MALRLSVLLDAADGGLKAELRLTQAEMAKLRQEANRTTRETVDAGKGMDSVGRSSDGLRGRLLGLRSALAGLGLGLLARELLGINTETDRLSAQLETATGSASGAARAFEMIRRFAADTPFQIDKVTEAFVRLTNLGLGTSIEALTSYGDTSAAMGRDIMQIVEAVADAVTGEFERLKEFGIRASQDGDRVRFTFKGITTEVGKSATEIEQYLIKLGQANFGGAAIRQMERLPGLISNMRDKLADLARWVGEGGLNDALRDAFGRINDFLGSGQELATALGSALGSAVTGVADAAGFLADNINLISAAAAAYITLNLAGTILSLVAPIRAVVAAMTALNLAMYANPATILVGAIAAFAGGLAYVVTSSDQASAAQQAHSDRMTEARRIVAELTGAEGARRRELILSRDELIKSAEAEIVAAAARLDAAKVSARAQEAMFNVAPDDVMERIVSFNERVQEASGMLLDAQRALEALRGSFASTYEDVEDTGKAIQRVTEFSKEQAKALETLRDRLDPVAAKWRDVDKESRQLLDGLKAGKITYEEYLRLIEALGREVEVWSAAQDQAARSVREQAEDLELSNQLRRLELEGTEEARTKILDLTLARELHRLEMEREAALMAAQPEQIDGINAAYDRLAEAIEDDGAVKQLERIQAQADPMAEAFKNAAESIQRGFSDAFFQIFREGRLRMDDLVGSIKDLFARTLAEMATLAIARPIIVPMVQALGGVMGVGQSAVNGVVQSLGGTAVDAGADMLGIGSGVQGMWSAFSGGASGLATSFATSSVGASLGLSTSANAALGAAAAEGLGMGGASVLTGAGSAFAAAAPYVAAAVAAITIATALFKKQPSDYTASFQGLLGGDLIQTEDPSDGSKPGTRQARDQLQEAYTTSIDAVLKALDVELPTGGYLDVAAGERDGQRFWYYETGGEDLAGKPLSSRPDPVASGRYDSPEALIGGILEAITDKVTGLSDTMRRVVDQVDFSDLEQAFADINLGKIYDSLGETPEEVAEAQAAIDAINAQFEELAEFATKFGLALDPVMAAQEKALQDMAAGYTDTLRDQILQITDPVQLQIRALDDWRDAQIRNATAIGQANGRVGASSEDLALIQELYALRLQGVTGEVNGALTGLTEVTRAVFLDQISAVEDFRDELARKAESFRRIIDTLRQAQLSLLIDSNLSPLSPQARYEEARRQFDDVRRRARLGDQDAAAELPEIARAFLEVSRAFNGDAQAFNADFSLVQTELEEAKAVAQRHLTTADQQLGRLDSQIKLLRDQLDTGRLLVTSFDQANGILEQILAALAAAPANAGAGSWAGQVPGIVNNAGGGVNIDADQIPTSPNGNASGPGGQDAWQEYLSSASAAQLAAAGLSGSVGSREEFLASIGGLTAAQYVAAGLTGKAFASGGRVTGGIEGVDSVRAVMMPDEFVVRTAAARQIGFDTLESINRTGRLPSGGSGSLDLSPVVGAIGTTTAAVTAGAELQADQIAALAEEVAALSAAVAEQGRVTAEAAALMKKRAA